MKQRLLVFINALDDVAFSPVLDFYELLPAITSTNDSEKVDRIIGTVIQKGNVACNKFLDCLIAKDILTYEEIKGIKLCNKSVSCMVENVDVVFPTCFNQ